MKAKIVLKHATIELEGTAEELRPYIEEELGRGDTTITLQPQIVPTTDLGKMLDDLKKAAPEPNPWQPVIPWITYNDMCPAGGAHDYPAVWMSTSPASCSKCGKRAAAISMMTCTVAPTIEQQS